MNFKLNIKNIQDFSFVIKQKKNSYSINTTIESLCKYVNELLEDNKKMKNEIKELKSEIMTLKEAAKKGVLQNTNEGIKEIKNINQNYHIIDSDILKNKEDKEMLCKWIREKTKMNFKLLYKVTRDGDRYQHLMKK